MRKRTAEYRLAQRWRPKDAEEIGSPDGLGVAYLAPYANGKFQVLGYAGTAGKPSFNFLYVSREIAERKIQEWFKALLAHKVFVLERREEQNKPHTLEVGDVITNSWGYDQTNVDCYQITRKTDHFVWLRPIYSELVPNEGCAPMAGRVVPVPGRFIENQPETKHKASGSYVSMKCGSGSKWDGRSLYCSWYA